MSDTEILILGDGDITIATKGLDRPSLTTHSFCLRSTYKLIAVAVAKPHIPLQEEQRFMVVWPKQKG
jgi:hypothetical protein